MSPLTPKLIISGFFGLVYGLVSFFLMMDLPDAPRWGLISGLSAFGLLLLYMLLSDEFRARRYEKAEKQLPCQPTFRMGANLRTEKKVAGVNVYLCGTEIVLINVRRREPEITRLPRHELRKMILVPPVELRLETYDGSRLLLLSPYMEEFIRHLRMSGWPVDESEN
jgi:hypothetical protein